MTGTDNIQWAGDNGRRRGQPKKELEREIAALGGQDNLAGYDWYQSRKARVTTKAVSGGTDDERISTVGSSSDASAENVKEDQTAEEFLLNESSSSGELTCSEECYETEDDAHIAASERYLAASLAAKRETTWRVYKLDDGTYSFTYAHAGGKGKRQARLPSPNTDLKFISAGHTHWDSNTAFSGQDWRIITQEKKTGFGIKMYVATKDGKLQYSTPKASRKLGIERGLKFLPPTSNYNGTYLENININTNWSGL